MKITLKMSEIEAILIEHMRQTLGDTFDTDESDYGWLCEVDEEGSPVTIEFSQAFYKFYKRGEDL